MRQARLQTPLSLFAAAAALACTATLPRAAAAEDFKLSDGVAGSVATTLSLGTTIRAQAPNPAEYAYIPATTVPGAAPGQLVGQTGGSDLNFGQGDPVSTIAEAMVDLDVHGATFGAFARVAAWHDFTLGHADAAYGNYANGYAGGTPLSDRGFQPGARFDGLMLRDAYVSAHAGLDAGRRLDLRLGRQLLGVDPDQALTAGSWGVMRMIGGGIAAATNPQDFAAQLRPGAIAEESRVPVGMLDLRVASGAAAGANRWTLEGFLPYETREAVLPGCGTFYDIASVVPPGCDLASAVGAPVAGTPLTTVAALTEKSLLASNYYVHRTGDQPAGAHGQFGLAAHLDLAALNTTLSAYALNTPSTLPFYQVRVDDVGGQPIQLPAALGQVGVIASALLRLNPAAKLPPLPALSGVVNGFEYDIAYPASVRLYGLSFNARPDPLARVYGELAHRDGQPLSYNLNDVLAAFLLRAPTSLLAEQRGALAAPAGSVYDAYQRFGVSTAALGYARAFKNLIGAQQLRVAVEAGASHVDGLPDPETMRYGRAFAYGSAPYLSNGTLTPGCGALPAGVPAAFAYVPGKTCGGGGFVTSSAWGWRLSASAAYAGPGGSTITPSLYVARDVSGYAFDGSYSAGRSTIRPAMRIDWDRRYYAQFTYTGMSGGDYNLLADRSAFTLAGGAKF
ncbi:MAG: DUF1302 family protein [Pelomonas sp.]|nr:DUF1302 family protein [Roseateles sp.]